MSFARSSSLIRKVQRTAVSNYIRQLSTVDFHDKESIRNLFGKIDQKGNGTISKEEFVNSYDVMKAHLEAEDAAKPPVAAQSLGSVLAKRFTVTAEVCVSKIFPAGFGWQGGCVAATHMGYGSTDMGLFLLTGAGDAVGVGIGHLAYYALKNALGYKQDMTAQAHTSVLLSTACMFSGTAWQPLVNFLHDSGLGFDGTALGVVGGCSFLFFAGLRFGRLLWSPILTKVEKATYANLKADAGLGVAVGGATGAFVGTDVSFVVDGVDSNWLRPYVGVEDTATEIEGMVTAGVSTALGFTAVQTVQNVTVTPGKNWVD